MPAIRKTTRQAHKTVDRVASILKKAQKHHRQAKNTVKAVQKIHKEAKKHAKKTKPFKTASGRSNYGGNKGDMRKTARRAYRK